MNVNELYYQNVYLKEFEASVVSCVKGKKGYEIVLDQTAFYPEGGGQLCDQGTLNGIWVKEVKEKDQIIHYTDEAIEIGTKVKGCIDWERRFDHMQNHTGEHILSGVIHQLFGYENVGFHMSDDHILVDYDGMMSEDDVKRVEALSNEIIRRHEKILVTYPSKEELDAMDFRCKKELSGTVRIVDIPGCDVCACCGTHVDNTAEVNLIKVINFEKHKDGIRLELLCGNRALKDYEMKHMQNMHLYQLFSVKPDEVESMVKKVQEEAKQQRFEVNELWKRLLAMRIDQIEPTDFIIECFEESVPKDQLKNFANGLLVKCDTLAVLVPNRESFNYLVMSKSKPLRALSRELNKALNGKGGGSDEMIQGTFSADKDTIIKVLKEMILFQ